MDEWVGGWKVESGIVVTKSCEEEEWGVLSNEYRVLVWDDEKVLEMDDGDCCITM